MPSETCQFRWERRQVDGADCHGCHDATLAPQDRWRRACAAWVYNAWLRRLQRHEASNEWWLAAAAMERVRRSTYARLMEWEQLNR